MSHTAEQAPRSPDADGRLFACINNPVTDASTNHDELILHDYKSNHVDQYKAVLGITAHSASDNFIEKLQGVEPNVAMQIKTMREAVANMPGELMRKLLHGKFDVTVLIRSTGGGTALAALYNNYFDSVVAKEGIETIASTDALSAGLTLFAHGERRLAFPGTKFMIHRSGKEKQYNSIITEPHRKWVTEVEDPAIDRVLESVREPHRAQLANLFAKDRENLAAERRIEFTGQDAPGFVTAYLDEKIPVSQQLEHRYGVQIPMKQYLQYGLSEFALLAQLDRDISQSPYAHYGLRPVVRNGKLGMDMAVHPGDQLPTVGKFLNESVREHTKT